MINKKKMAKHSTEDETEDRAMQKAAIFLNFEKGRTVYHVISRTQY